MRTLPIQFPCSKSLFGPATLRSNSTLDYASNVALYPKFQDYIRSKRPPLLAVWGKDDPFFLLPGAEAFKHDNRNAELYFYESTISRLKPVPWDAVGMRYAGSCCRISRPTIRKRSGRPDNRCHVRPRVGSRRQRRNEPPRWRWNSGV
jgi:hypothetical protein